MAMRGNLAAALTQSIKRQIDARRNDATLIRAGIIDHSRKWWQCRNSMTIRSPACNGMRRNGVEHAIGAHRPRARSTSSTIPHSDFILTRNQRLARRNIYSQALKIMQRARNNRGDDHRIDSHSRRAHPSAAIDPARPHIHRPCVEHRSRSASAFIISRCRPASAKTTLVLPASMASSIVQTLKSRKTSPAWMT